MQLCWRSYWFSLGCRWFDWEVVTRWVTKTDEKTIPPHHRPSHGSDPMITKLAHAYNRADAFQQHGRRVLNADEVNQSQAAQRLSFFVCGVVFFFYVGNYNCLSIFGLHGRRTVRLEWRAMNLHKSNRVIGGQTAFEPGITRLSRCVAQLNKALLEFFTVQLTRWVCSIDEGLLSILLHPSCFGRTLDLIVPTLLANISVSISWNPFAAHFG